MADIKSPEARSENMSRIRAKDTKPEIWFRKKLFSQGFRYRKNVRKLPGTPDLWLAKYHTAIFVHGCFWHRHLGCRYAYTPKSNFDFWENKFRANVKRDLSATQQLQAREIRVLIVWECTIKAMMRSGEKREEVFAEISQFLTSLPPVTFLEL